MRLRDWLNSEIFRDQTGNLTAEDAKPAEKDDKAVE